MEKKLAHRFALILNEWIGDHLAEVNRINAERNYASGLADAVPEFPRNESERQTKPV